VRELKSRYKRGQADRAKNSKIPGLAWGREKKSREPEITSLEEKPRAILRIAKNNLIGATWAFLCNFALSRQGFSGLQKGQRTMREDHLPLGSNLKGEQEKFSGKESWGHPISPDRGEILLDVGGEQETRYREKRDYFKPDSAEQRERTERKFQTKSGKETFSAI